MTDATATHSLRLPRLALVLLALVAYHNSFDGVFLFDDLRLIVHNTALQCPVNLPETLRQSARPVLDLTFALNYIANALLGRDDPMLYHLVNLVIHVLAALTLFAILRFTFSLERMEQSLRDRAVGLAFVISAIWAVHPLGTQAVTYIVQRGESLMSLLMLAALWALIGSHRFPGRRPWGGMILVCFALGLGVKQVMIVCPLVLWLYDWLFLTPRDAGAWSPLKRRPLIYGGMFTLLIATLIWITTSSAWQGDPSAGLGVANVTTWTYLMTQSLVLLHYLRLVVWPHPLVLDYFWLPTATFAQAWPAALLWVALLGLTAWGVVKRHPLAMVGCWFFLLLAPTSSFVPIIDAAVEHRMYLPMVAPLTLIVLGIWWYLQRVTGSHAIRIGQVVAALAMVVFAGLTMARNRDYHSEIAMWRSVTEARPENPKAWYNLAIARRDDQQFAAGVEAMRKAIAIEPRRPQANLELGNMLVELGQLNQAIDAFQRELILRPDHAPTLFALSQAYAKRGDLRPALNLMQRLIAAKPDEFAYHVNAAMLQYQLGDRAAAIASLKAAITRAREHGAAPQVTESLEALLRSWSR